MLWAASALHSLNINIFASVYPPYEIEFVLKLSAGVCLVCLFVFEQLGAVQYLRCTCPGVLMSPQGKFHTHKCINTQWSTDAMIAIVVADLRRAI